MPIDNKLVEVTQEAERLRSALRDVVNPMRVLTRQAAADGSKLNGSAYAIANDLNFVKSIAREALSSIAPRQEDQA